MKWFKIALAGGASLLAMTAHARADFVITPLAYTLFSGALGSVFSFSAIYTGLSIALSVGVSLLGSGLLGGGQQQRVADPGQYRSVFESTEASEVNAIGRCLLGGLKVFGNTKTNSRYRLIAHARGPLVAIEEYRVGGRTVVVEGDGRVSSPPYANTGGSFIHVFTKAGSDDENAWPDLISEFPALWTPAHRVRGIAQTLARYISPGLDSEDGIAKFNKLFQGGEPDVAIIGRYDTCYDPRDGTQSPTSRATWRWSQNGILCAARIMMRYPELTAADFDWTDIAAEADKADALVATRSGTEPRSRCSGVWLSESLRGDTMQQVLDSVGAEIQTSDDGKIRIRLVDDSPASEGTLPVLHAGEWDWKSGPEAVERPNLCRVQYYSAERNYEMADIDLTGAAWARVDAEIDRYGEKLLDIKLPFCPSASQAQRLARRQFLLARADTGRTVTNWDGLWAWGRSYANIEFPDLDESPLCKLAPPRIDDANGQVEIPYAVWPAELIGQPWNPATMEVPAPEQVPEIVYESEVPTPMAGTPILVRYPSGAYEIRFPYSVDVVSSAEQAIYRTYTAGNPNAWSSMDEVRGPYFAYAAAGTPGTQADLRVQSFDADDNPSDWSPTVHITLALANGAPAAPEVGSLGSLGTFSDVTIGSLSAVEMRLRRRYRIDGGSDYGPWEQVDQQNARPGTAYVMEDPSPPVVDVEGEAVNYQIIAYSSNGTAGPAYDYEFVFHTPDP
ncbi:MAG: hypothetical protein J0H53_05245 [Rhizobiales bacterium]|nr:hypothetical protein [Hyphomicrobiales bacterium]